MEKKNTKSYLTRQIKTFVRARFRPSFDQLKGKFKSNPLWRRLRELGSQLWLDTGSIEGATQMWTRDFSALTTNNTLLNKEVQKGTYDSLISEADELLSRYAKLSEKERMLEIAFILNARHGLRLVEQFDAYVSVEEHTDLAHDVGKTVEYARRYHEICPERFIIKIPLTPTGLLATRKLAAEGIPVNHTLGFSARQNYVIARIGQPAYVNIFLGRLNSFVAENNLGSGDYVGEKATLASQAILKKLRRQGLTRSLQIGASFREGKQLLDLAGIDVMTIPPKVAAEFLAVEPEREQIIDRTDSDFKLGLDKNVDLQRIRLNTLWEVDDKLVECVDTLEKENIDSFTANDLVNFLKRHGSVDLFVEWTDAEIATSTTEGKIPHLESWQDALADKSIGLDSLINLAGLCSFSTDQKAMDDRIRQVLTKP